MKAVKDTAEGESGEKHGEEEQEGRPEKGIEKAAEEEGTTLAETEKPSEDTPQESLELPPLTAEPTASVPEIQMESETTVQEEQRKEKPQDTAEKEGAQDVADSLFGPAEEVPAPNEKETSPAPEATTHAETAASVQQQDDGTVDGDDYNEDEEEEEEEEEEDNGMFSSEDEAGEAFESQLKYATHLSMYCTNSMISTYSLLLSRVDVLPRLTYQALVGVLERILADVPGSVGFFWQLPMFTAFERVLSDEYVVRQNVKSCTVKLREMIVRIMSEFFAAAQKGPSLYVRVFAWRTKGSNMMLTGAKKSRGKNNQGSTLAAVMESLGMTYETEEVLAAHRRRYEEEAASTELTIEQIQALVESRPQLEESEAPSNVEGQPESTEEPANVQPSEEETPAQTTEMTSEKPESEEQEEGSESDDDEEETYHRKKKESKPATQRPRKRLRRVEDSSDSESSSSSESDMDNNDDDAQ